MPIRVLVATDGSPSSRITEQFAIRLARAVPAELLLAHVLDLQKLEYKMIPDFQVEMIRQGAKRTAEGLLDRETRFFREHGVEVAPRLLVGSPGPALCEYASREGAAFAVVGRRGHGDLQDLLFGSISNHVVHHCPTPVLVTKRNGPAAGEDVPGGPVRALVALDGSAASRRAVEFLAGLAEARGGLELSLIHVVSPERGGVEHLSGEARFEVLRAMHEEAEGLLARNAERLREVGFRVTTRVEEGAPGKTLCRVYQEDAFDLLTLGRRGLGELDDLLFGSVCHFVVHHCPGHVLVVT